jgi:2-iminobutanoate/2-iminopropanoate deaminase
VEQLTKPLANYEHVRMVGDIVFVAGQGCRNPETNEYVGLTRDGSGQITNHDMTAQASGVLQNIERALQSIGLNRHAIVDVTVFLMDMQDFPKMNAVWNEFFTRQPFPTRTTVAVKKLPGDNFVEMKAIATRSQPR